MVATTYAIHNPKNRFRALRFALFKSTVDRIIAEQGKCRILDLGGTQGYWETFGSDLDWNKIEVHIVNLSSSETNHPKIKMVVGDARNVKEFDDLSFDIVHSNSVIEHVGRWNDMTMMANEVRRLAPKYFVQTPYYWFPIEPHARFLFLHWMPEFWRYRIIMKRRCGYWQKQPDVGGAMRAIQSAVLVDKVQMQSLFPDARILTEKFWGATKSLIAVR